MISGRETAEQLSGPLGIAQLSGDIAKQTVAVSGDTRTLALNSVMAIFELAANMSVAIGFINLLPVPMLEGGHLLFYAYEVVARRQISAKVQGEGYRVGLALDLGLMLFATWNSWEEGWVG